MLIRSAQPDDVGTILELSARLYSEDGETLFDEGRASTALDAMLDSEDLGVVLVAEKRGEVAGFLVLVWGFSLESGGRDAFVDELYVAPEWRSAGIGTALMRAAETASERAGARVVHLVVEGSNVGARRFYRRLGYTGREIGLFSKRLS
jgi:ribosomal protein S18 acetylase RimI-like enzyme